MKLFLITTQDCPACIRAEKTLEKIVRQHREISLTVIDARDYNRRGIFIFPALFVNDELFSYGDIDEPTLLSRVSKNKKCYHKSN